MNIQTLVGKDGKRRCSWYNGVDEFIPYHDTEWGFPVTSDTKLFEKLCLEGFQAGLSWRTILVKRERFRKVFKDFDFVDTSVNFILKKKKTFV